MVKRTVLFRTLERECCSALGKIRQLFPFFFLNVCLGNFLWSSSSFLFLFPLFPFFFLCLSLIPTHSFCRAIMQPKSKSGPLLLSFDFDSLFRLYSTENRLRKRACVFLHFTLIKSLPSVLFFFFFSSVLFLFSADVPLFFFC